MMTAHIVYPALDPHHPATMSRAILNDLLREMGYKGVIITDGMDMHAIAHRYGPASGRERADRRRRHGDGDRHHAKPRKKRWMRSPPPSPTASCRWTKCKRAWTA
jgi:transposase-like protein